MGNNLSAIHLLEKIERTETLTEQTYLSLRKLIMSGKLSPGEKITGRQIAKAMNVSLTPSRESIGRLIVEGALIPGINQGALVPTLNRNMYKEISDCRILIEGNLASKSIMNFEKNDIIEVEEILNKMVSATDSTNFSDILNYNTDFHFKIYQKANMPIMLGIVENLWLKIGPTLNLLRPFYQETRQGINHHVEFINAVKNQNAQKAKKAITQDISLATKHILGLLQD